MTKAVIAPSDKLSSVLCVVLVIFCRRSKRVGLVLSCVWFSCELCSENAGSSSWDRLWFAVKYGSFLRDNPTPFTTAVATGTATVEYKHHVFLPLRLPPPPANKGCCVCGV